MNVHKILHEMLSFVMCQKSVSLENLVCSAVNRCSAYIRYLNSEQFVQSNKTKRSIEKQSKAKQSKAKEIKWKETSSRFSNYLPVDGIRFLLFVYSEFIALFETVTFMDFHLLVNRVRNYASINLHSSIQTFAFVFAIPFA